MKYLDRLAILHWRSGGYRSTSPPIFRIRYTMMKRQSMDKREIVRYLLDELPPLEQFEFEAHCFGGDELAAEVEMVRDEMIEDYMHGALPPHERGRFEQFFLSYPPNVERLAELRSLDRALDAPHLIVKPNRARNLEQRVVDFVRAKISVPVLVAATLALFAGAAWLSLTLWRSAGTTKIAQNTENRIPSPPQIPSPTNTRNTGVPPQATPELPQATPDIDPGNSSPDRPNVRGGAAPGKPSTVIASFLLTPLSRGPGDDSPFRIPAHAQLVKITAEIPPARYSKFFVVLRHAGDDEAVWRKNFQTPRVPDSPSRVAFLVPARLFSDDDFILDVKGYDRPGQAETVVSYSFRAVKGK